MKKSSAFIQHAFSRKKPTAQSEGPSPPPKENHELFSTFRYLGIEVYDSKSDFVEFRRAGEYSSMHYARRADGPGEGRLVTVKVLASMIPPTEEKEYKFIDFERMAFERECRLLNRIRGHPNVQRFIGVVSGFVDARGHKCVGLLCKNVPVDLRTFAFGRQSRLLLRPTIQLRLKLMQDVATALAFLHKMKIEHHDVRARNVEVVLQNGINTALVGCFDYARDFSSPTIVKKWQVPIVNPSVALEWRPPELYKDEDKYLIFKNGTGDMWSFGCTMIEVLAGVTTIWSADYTKSEIKQIFAGKSASVLPIRPESFPPWDSAWDFIHACCMKLIPSERITAGEAIGELGRLLETVQDFEGINDVANGYSLISE